MEKRQPRSTDLPPSNGSLLFEGDFAFCTLADVLQLVSTSRHAVKVEIHEGGQELGYLVLLNGVITQCVAGPNHSEGAFFHLWEQRHGRFRVVPASGGPLAEAPAMATTWREMVFEAARLEDEARRSPEQARTDMGRADFLDLTLSSHAPAASAEEANGERAAPEGSTGAPLAARLPSEPATAPQDTLRARLSKAMDAYLRRDFADALRDFEDCLASAPADPRILLMIERIKDRQTRR